MFKILPNLQSKIDSLRTDLQNECKYDHLFRFNNAIDTLQEIKDTKLIENFVSTAQSIRWICDREDEESKEMNDAMGITTANWCDAFADFSNFINGLRDHERDKLIKMSELANEKNQCETEKDNLTKNNTDLTSKVSNLTEEKDQYEAQKQKLTQEKSDLESQIDRFTKLSKEFCNELDQTQMAMDGTHHDCMNIII